MKNKLKKAGYLAPLGAALLTPVQAFAQETTINLSPPKAISGVTYDINQIIAFVINTLVVVGVVASLIFLLYGGLRWVISGGDKAKVDSARGTIVAAIVGLIIVILSWVIINAVLTILTGKGIAGLNLSIGNIGGSK